MTIIKTETTTSSPRDGNCSNLRFLFFFFFFKYKGAAYRRERERESGREGGKRLTEPKTR